MIEEFPLVCQSVCCNILGITFLDNGARSYYIQLASAVAKEIDMGGETVSTSRYQ